MTAERFPEGPDESRFRIYRCARGDQEDRLKLLATCADAAAVGVALVTLEGEGEFAGARPGVLLKADPDLPGHWVISPFSA